jgi:hypothetical protein
MSEEPPMNVRKRGLLQFAVSGLAFAFTLWWTTPPVAPLEFLALLATASLMGAGLLDAITGVSCWKSLLWTDPVYARLGLERSAAGFLLALILLLMCIVATALYAFLSQR